jgi:hypothetical protein
VRSLSDSLKIKKKKSRVAINQLLTVTMMQHNELIAKFHVKMAIFKRNMIPLSASCNVAVGTRYSTIQKQLSAY